eukprot:3581337-Pyramimonas_sp.AAC.1
MVDGLLVSLARARQPALGSVALLNVAAPHLIALHGATELAPNALLRGARAAAPPDPPADARTPALGPARAASRCLIPPRCPAS